MKATCLKRPTYEIAQGIHKASGRRERKSDCTHTPLLFKMIKNPMKQINEIQQNDAHKDNSWIITVSNQHRSQQGKNDHDKLINLALEDFTQRND